MPSSTPLGALTNPLDSDPLADVYGYMRAILAKLDKKVIRKPALQSVINATVLQNDTHLLFTVEAGKTYVFDAALLFNVNNSAIDARVGFSFPAGTMSFGVIGMDPAVATGTVGAGSFGAVPAAVSGTSFVAVGVGANDTTVRVMGSFTATAAGTVRLMWAQNVATATNMNLSAGSWLRVEAA